MMRALLVFALAGWTAQEIRSVRVGIYEDGGTSSRGPENLEKCLKEAPDISFERVKAADLLAGALGRLDVLIMPGGSASKEADTLTEEGRAAVRKFVESGGGYVGFCAGAYLATVRNPKYLKILDAFVADTEHWARGTGTVKVRLTEEGRKILGAKEEVVDVYYANGPLLASADTADLPDFTTLGTFETEMTKNGPEGVMKGKVAIACGAFGKGRVWCFSPHPERTAGLEDFVRRAVRWSAGAKLDR